MGSLNLSAVIMSSRSTWSWSRPTPHIYSYTRELKRQTEASSATSVAEVSRRSRAKSVISGVEQSTGARSARAMSAAPAGQSFLGYSGYYGRQLAMMKESSKASASSASASMSASSASASASKSVAATKTTAVTTKTSVAATKTIEQKSAVKIDLAALNSKMSESLQYGRSSSSKALRRAEMHAVSSGKDPRHVLVPYNIDDDINYRIAGLHITPFEGKETSSAKAAYMQGRLKVERMEKELNKVTSSAMSYKSIYAKSASQMAQEAMMACEADAASSKKTRKTVIETSSKKSVTAA